MATVASPRPSSVLSSSRRGSASSSTTTLSASARPTTAAAAPTPLSASTDRSALRRNRSALRDYYNLPATAGPTPTTAPVSEPSSSLAAPGPAAEAEDSSSSSSDSDSDSELDSLQFDAQTHARALLSSLGPEATLRSAALLAGRIRGLDGEKKALVYDNYSRLIGATETIRKMRRELGPLETGSEKLMPEVGRIAETAREVAERKRGQKEVVRWVVEGPKRMERWVREGRREEAEREGERVGAVLERWEGVRGVEEVRRGCEAALAGDG